MGFVFIKLPGCFETNDDNTECIQKSILPNPHCIMC